MITDQIKKRNKILEKIFFTPEGEEPVEFYVLEQTVIGGQNYILVTDAETYTSSRFSVSLNASCSIVVYESAI